LIQVLGIDEDFSSFPVGPEAIMSQALFLAPLIDQGGGDACVLSRPFFDLHESPQKIHTSDDGVA
jgi:hypothetical protein